MDTEKLAATFGDKFKQVLARSATGETDPAAVKSKAMQALGMTDAAMHRAAMTAALDFGISGDGDLAFLFAVAFSIGDGGALRRARLALTDPRAKGREVAVLDALIAGDELENAIRQASAPHVDAPGASVVPFKRP